MAVRILAGRAGSGKSRRCCEEIQCCMDAGIPAILLVPDQATYDAERRLAEELPQNGFSHVHVVGFSRLAYRVFAERGNRPLSLSDLAKRLIFQRIGIKKEKDLQALQKAARQRNFSELIKDFVGECRSFCIGPEDLRLAAAKSTLGLGKKLEDAAMLYEEYDAYINEHLGGSQDMFTLLEKEIAQSELVKKSHVWVDGFHWFTPQQMQVLRQLARYSPAMTIALTLPAEDIAGQRRESALFHRPWQVYEEIRSSIGIAEEIYMEAAPRYKEESGLAGLERALFASSAQRCRMKEIPGLYVYEAETREAELDGLAREMLALCRDQGWRWRDMAVILRSRDEYGDLPERVLESYGIPFFTDRRRSMLEHPLAELWLAGLDMACRGWNYDDVFRLLKTDLLPLSREETDELENYCLAYGIRSWQWEADEDWEYYDRRSLEETRGPDSDTKAWLARINGLRRRVRAAAAVLMDGRKERREGGAWCRLLLAWLEELQVPNQLKQWQEISASPLKEHEQMWKAVLTLLEELYRISEREELSAEEFAGMVKDGMDGLEFSFIPPTLDHVMITSVDRSYGIERKGIFLIGANDGIFPGRSQEDGLLHDEERQQLAKLGLLLAPDGQFKTLQEKFLFYLACTRSRERLYLSYSLSDGAGGALEPSLPVRQITADWGLSGRWSALPSLGDEADWIVRKERSLQWLPLLLRRAKDGGKIGDAWWGLYDWALEQEGKERLQYALSGLFWRPVLPNLPKDVVRMLYMPKGRMTGSVTRFESYQACPFQFFARYGLRLEERPVFTLRPPDTGQLVHSVLRQLGAELLKKRQQWRDIPKEEISARCRAAIEKLAPQVQNGIFYRDAMFMERKERIDKTIVRTMERLHDFSRVSEFNTLALEKSFGFGRLAWDPLHIPLPDGAMLDIIGQIDRIDMLKDEDRKHILVMDYKSGNNTIKAEEIYYGIKLQLLVYVYMVLLNIDAEPAGALYCYVNNRQTSADAPPDEESMADAYCKELKMKGYLIKDEAVIRRLDTSVDGYSSYVNVYLKNGKFRAGADGVKDAETWDIMLRHTLKKLKEIGMAISRGAIDIAPMWHQGRGACLWCPYQSLCRFDSSSSVCRWRVLPSLRDEQAIERMKKEGGMH